MIRDLAELADVVAEGVTIRWRLRAASVCWWLSDHIHDVGAWLVAEVPGAITPIKLLHIDTGWPYDGDQPLPEWEAELAGYEPALSPWRHGQLLADRR